MTGCYLYAGRDCFFIEGQAKPRVCLHCGCPESERSRFSSDPAEAALAKARVSNWLMWNGKNHKNRTKESRRAEKARKDRDAPPPEPRIAEALAETKANVEAAKNGG